MNTAGTNMPQLDGVRAVAFMAVAFSHWMPEDYQLGLPWGTGVQLFFVLSGFLITGILLRNRPEDTGATTASVLRAFYMRRFLRIFPLYYGVLAVCVLLAVGPILNTWPWHVSYLSNIFYARHGHTGSLNDPFLHFWSLAVEEQFYILWPLIALVAPRRALYFVLCGSIFAALGFRIFIGHHSTNVYAVRYLTPSCLDALGVGGLIAYAQHYKGLKGLRRVKRLLAGVGIVGLLCTVSVGQLTGSKDAHWIGHTFLIVFYGAIVAQAAEGFAGVLGKVLRFPPLVYLGKISYGLYVYHYFAPLALTGLLRATGLSATLAQQFPLNVICYMVLTLTAAITSWHLYEVQFLKLKRRFDYPSFVNRWQSVAPQAASPLSNT